MKRRADDYDRPAPKRGGLVGKAIGVDEDEDAKTKYVPVHEQVVTDENGKRRFHGAFEGGFAAGYFNTVGSKEGWTPSTFVSSRANKAKMASAKPEDFMDESDKIQIYGAKELTTTRDFDLLGGTAAELQRRNAAKAPNAAEASSSSILGPVLDELIVPTEDPVGIRLLRVMGWRAGQGIGSRLRKKTKKKDKEKEKEREKEALKQKEAGKRVYGVELPPELLNKQDEESDEEEDIHALNYTFAREDTQEVEYKAKNDMYGIGYDPYTSAPEFRDKKAQASKPINTKVTMSSIFGGGHSSQEGAFGIGAYEEADDEEVYSTDNLDMYDRELFDGPVIEKAPPKPKEPKPDFHKPVSGPIRRCSDGLLPLRHFVLASRSILATKWFPPITVPANFKPFHSFDSPLPSSTSSQKPGSAADKLDANTRAVMLGEERMPITSKPSSVFDFLSPADRERLSNLTGKFIPGSNPLTPQQQEEQKRKLEEQNKKMEEDRKRLEEEKKRAEEERKKMEEKRMQEQKALQEKQMAAQQAAQQAILSMLSSRFAKAEDATIGTLSTQVHKGGQTTAAEFAKTLPSLLGAPSSQDTAASFGMLGKLTRSEVEWRPTNLLCKRFNLRNPHADNEVESSGNNSRVGNDWMEQLGANTGPTFGLEFPDKEAEEKPSTNTTARDAAALVQGASSFFPPTSATSSASVIPSSELLDEEEVTRPPIDLFKAIFEAEDEEPEKEEEEEDGNDSEEERVKEEEKERERERERERDRREREEQQERDRREADRRTGWDKMETEEVKPKIQPQVHITEDQSMDDDVIWVERSADDIKESKKKDKKDKHKKDKKDKKEKKEKKDKHKHRDKKDKKDKDKHKHRDKERDKDRGKDKDRDRDRDKERSRDKHRD